MSLASSFLLIVESDDEQRNALTTLFESEGLRVRAETDADACVSVIMSQEPAVIILAEDMPPVGSAAFLPVLRRLTKAPIVVVGSGGEDAIVGALLRGADMYMRRPLNHRELMSRVRALLRRSDASPA